MITENSRSYLNKFQAQPCNYFDKVLPEMAESLGELIIRRMKDLGIRNNSELARLIKRSDAYVGDLVNDRGKTKSGTYTPRPETLANLSKILQVSEMEILSAIGYTSEKSINDSHEIYDGVTINFQNGKNLSKKKQKELLDAARLIARGVMSQEDED